MAALIARLLVFFYFQKVYGHQKNFIAIENLSALIGEYDDCEVSLVLFSPDSTTFNPITTTSVTKESSLSANLYKVGFLEICLHFPALDSRKTYPVDLGQIKPKTNSVQNCPLSHCFFTLVFIKRVV